MRPGKTLTNSKAGITPLTPEGKGIKSALLFDGRGNKEPLFPFRGSKNYSFFFDGRGNKKLPLHFREGTKITPSP